MSGYFFLLVITGFLLFFIFFSVERKRKISALLRETDLTGISRLLRINFIISWLCLTGLFFASLCYVLFPGIYLYPIASLDLDFINSGGAFIVKVAFIALIASGIYISKTFDQSPDLTLEKICRIELLNLVIVAVLALGIFVFISSLFTFLNFALSLVSLLVFRSAHKALRPTTNQDRTNGASH